MESPATDLPVNSITQFIDNLIGPLCVSRWRVSTLLSALAITDGLLISSLGRPKLSEQFIEMSLAALGPLVWFIWRIIKIYRRR